ncbi:hypothetical protein DPMN_000645 [Dreissena polymorpha]|uniref:Uncharacterized protein n=1 Tax=Dreissena polymorpha TaxID=45954 RepID=A0A9D4RS78_DREPO|nr:hypothetical protein DPMN_000645 [Dreissena polymorpha]
MIKDATVYYHKDLFTRLCVGRRSESGAQLGLGAYGLQEGAQGLPSSTEVEHLHVGTKSRVHPVKKSLPSAVIWKRYYLDDDYNDDGYSFCGAVSKFDYNTHDAEIYNDNTDDYENIMIIMR